MSLVLGLKPGERPGGVSCRVVGLQGGPGGHLAPSANQCRLFSLRSLPGRLGGSISFWGMAASVLLFLREPFSASDSRWDTPWQSILTGKVLFDSHGTAQFIPLRVVDVLWKAVQKAALHIAQPKA